jgi:hypothetical protein
MGSVSRETACLVHRCERRESSVSSLRWVTEIGLIGYAEPIAVLRNLNCAVLRVTFNLGRHFR